MDSIIEKVREIKKSSISFNEKRRALVKLGLGGRDLDLVMGELELVHADEIRAGREARLLAAQAKVFTFGVEIECDVNRNRVREAAEVTGFAYEYQGYNHNDNMSCFKFVSDGSVGGDDPIECVSNVLKGADGKKALKCACDTLEKAGAKVNRTCGLHVHIGASDLTDEQYANVFANYYYLEPVIDKFMAPSRKNNTYAQTLQDHNVDNFTSKMSVREELCRDRYHKVNCVSWDRHKTIEFRQHQGTVNFEKIFNWVNFCGKLVKWSKTHRLDKHATSIDDMKFLSAKEKAFFKQRIETFANR